MGHPAMARELVTVKGIGERADAVWSALQKKQEEAFAVKATQPEEATPEVVKVAEFVTAGNGAVPPVQWEPIAGEHELIPRKGARRVTPCEGQLSLF